MVIPVDLLTTAEIDRGVRSFHELSHKRQASIILPDRVVTASSTVAIAADLSAVRACQGCGQVSTLHRKTLGKLAYDLCDQCDGSSKEPPVASELPICDGCERPTSDIVVMQLGKLTYNLCGDCQPF